MNNTNPVEKKDDPSKAALMPKGFETSVKKSFLKRGLKIFSCIFASILLSFILTFGFINHISINLITIKSKQLIELFEVYDIVNTPPTPEDVETFKSHLYHSPSGSMSIGWIIARALEHADGDADLGDTVTRQALHRLQGSELMLFIAMLDDKIKGFRPEGYTDVLATMPNIPEKVAQSVRENRDIYEFDESETKALKSCEKALIAQAGKYSFMMGYEAVINTVMPSFLMNACTLTGKIKI
jgi:hypothetical protein